MAKKQLIDKLDEWHLNALARWIRVHGNRGWKKALRDAWFTGRYFGLLAGRETDTVALTIVRLRIGGPSGLDKITTKQILARTTWK